MQSQVQWLPLAQLVLLLGSCYESDCKQALETPLSIPEASSGLLVSDSERREGTVDRGEERNLLLSRGTAYTREASTEAHPYGDAECDQAGSYQKITAPAWTMHHSAAKRQVLYRARSRKVLLHFSLFVHNINKLESLVLLPGEGSKALQDGGRMFLLKEGNLIHTLRITNRP